MNRRPWISLGPIPFWCSAFLALLVSHAWAQVHAGGIEIKQTPLIPRYCHIVRFLRGWEFKRARPIKGPINFDDYADYEFRAENPKGSRFLIGAPLDPASDRFNTSNWYGVDFAHPRAPAVAASREMWEGAAVVPLTRRSTFSEFTELEQDRAEFNGYRLAKSGDHWFGPPELVTRLSPDSGWLVLQSWTGSTDSPRMTVIEDVFDSASGKKILTIEGTCSSQDYPRGYFGRAAWLTERYFIVPLGERRERCLVCEFGVHNPPQGAKP